MGLFRASKAKPVGVPPVRGRFGVPAFEAAQAELDRFGVSPAGVRAAARAGVDAVELASYGQHRAVRFARTALWIGDRLRTDDARERGWTAAPILTFTTVFADLRVHPVLLGVWDDAGLLLPGPGLPFGVPPDRFFRRWIGARPDDADPSDWAARTVRWAAAGMPPAAARAAWRLPPGHPDLPGPDDLAVMAALHGLG